nr:MULTISPECIES: pirin family protein [unclassified Methylobacterium]
MDVTKLRGGDRMGDPSRGFAVEIIRPGLSLGGGDSGLGAIGRIDRATVAPGHLIGMHPHRDDEILTYVRAGRMLHRDTVGNAEEITATRLMMMNAGHTFQHEERMLDHGPVEALQIFLRPRAADLGPKVQFHDFGEVLSHGKWRLIAGPEGAPLEVRAQAWVSDAHVAAGAALSLPPLPAPDAVRLLHPCLRLHALCGLAGVMQDSGERGARLLDALLCEIAQLGRQSEAWLSDIHVAPQNLTPPKQFVRSQSGMVRHDVTVKLNEVATRVVTAVRTSRL